MDRPARQKIAIIGYTPHRQLAPWTDDDWEIWALNDLYLDLGIFQNDGFKNERLRWFQLHPWEAVRNWDKISRPGDELNPAFGPRHKRDPSHMLQLREMSKYFPVYLNQKHDEMPDCLVYPREEVFKYYAKYFTASDEFKYFTNSITQMIALAVMQLCPDPDTKPSEDAQIAVYGVDMQVGGTEANSEYGYQRPSCEWIAGYCMGHGIPFTLPDESDLLKTAFIYGDDDQFYLRKRLDAYENDLERRRIEAVNMREQARFNEGQMLGAKSAIEWLKKSHLPGDNGDMLGQVPIAHGHEKR